MGNMDVMYSSKTDQWATPQDFFDELDREFHFTLDPCADETNHKCKKFFTKEEDGLSRSWEREYFAIPRMVEKSANGSRSVMRKAVGRLWLCSYLLAQIPHTSTIISITKRRYGLSEAG